jgi:hypothetical protein
MNVVSKPFTRNGCFFGSTFLALSKYATICFQEFSNAKQTLTYASEKLVEIVDTSVTLLETLMAEVTHVNSAEQHIVWSSQSWNQGVSYLGKAALQTKMFVFEVFHMTFLRTVVRRLTESVLTVTESFV